MHEGLTWLQQTHAEKAVAALLKNHFRATFVPNKEEALKIILAETESNAVVGMGGSWTLSQLNMQEILEKRGNKVLNHNLPGLSAEEASAFRHQELSCDVFLSSVNALTLDGQLVNVDGSGNRVAAMIFGPKKTILVVGTNKLCPTVEDAISRIETCAAPVNAKRLNRKTPCTHTGICQDCESPERICNVTTIMHKKPGPSDILVILIGESLGF